MGFPRQVYWSGLPFPSPGVLPDPGIEPVSPKNWQAGSLPLRPLGSPLAIFPYGNTWPQQCVNSQNRKTERRAKDESREKVPIWNVVVITVVQSLSYVWLFATPWTATLQASLSFSISQRLLTHVPWVSDAIQPSHSRLPPSPPALWKSDRRADLVYIHPELPDNLGQVLSMHPGFYKPRPQVILSEAAV